MKGRSVAADFHWKDVEFEWNRHNLAKLEQEGLYRRPGRRPVYREEAEELFFNPNLIEGPKRVNHEERYYIWGSTDSGRLLFEVFVIKKSRTQGVPVIRIFSARDMDQDEANEYYDAMEAEDDKEDEASGGL